ncbi:glycine zipper 2TM domain-containing protein [Ignatzschineria cameli]|uniref:Glycine zipper 2TM domain-containing protein n=1 Tax=Ignatzschineria cameli TaxID=2182793 RepID=A0A2U2AT50_9GAMM|nr:glycine zipper 2TM domain-containing protein [Ignatzschineria cameli]PWD87920.1 hypothetical protein DC077_01170 [Ignatzschineria cameli]
MKKLTMIGLAVLTLAGCTNSSLYSGDVYTGNQAKTVQSVSYGTVVAVRPVTIQAEGSSLGTVSGAVLGGVLGNAMGGGRGRNITTAVGAVAGGIAGNKIEQQVDKVQGVELDIKTDSGQTIAVVQKQDKSLFRPGQRVRMVGSGRNINVSPL